MRAVVQRVSEASVVVGRETVGSIGLGLLVLVAVHRDDGENEVRTMARKISELRVFDDADGRMNRSVKQVSGSLLLVSQFTLYGDTRKGNRPSFSEAAAPEQARRCYDLLVECCRAQGIPVETGVFQAEMKVALVNEGPATFLLEISAPATPG